MKVSRSLQARSRAELFVADFLLTYLVGKDLNEIWQVKNPMGLLTKVLEENGRAAPESRFASFVSRWKSCLLYTSPSPRD